MMNPVHLRLNIQYRPLFRGCLGFFKRAFLLFFVLSTAFSFLGFISDQAFEAMGGFSVLSPYLEGSSLEGLPQKDSLLGGLSPLQNALILVLSLVLTLGCDVLVMLAYRDRVSSDYLGLLRRGLKLFPGALRTSLLMNLILLIPFLALGPFLIFMVSRSAVTPLAFGIAFFWWGSIYFFLRYGFAVEFYIFTLKENREALKYSEALFQTNRSDLVLFYLLLLGLILGFMITFSGVALFSPLLSRLVFSFGRILTIGLRIHLLLQVREVQSCPSPEEPLEGEENLRESREE